MSDDIIDRLRCAYSKGDEPPCEACTFCVARAEIERLRSLLDGVDNLHRKIRIRLDDGEIDEVCDQCEDFWPCVTHVFLHPEKDWHGDR